MKILTVDVGTGTQDIYLYDSRLDLENGYKLIVPSPTMIIHARIKAATSRREAILLSGVTMGGGPSQWAAEEHVRAGLSVYATPEAARSFNDDLDEVEKMGIQIVAEEEALHLPESVVRLVMCDFDFNAIMQALAEFGVSLRDLQAVAVAVFDHGNAPPHISDRQFRFDYLDDRIRAENRLSAFAYRSGDVPAIMTRLQAVVASYDHFMAGQNLNMPLVVMDTAPAAVLGASYDSMVRKMGQKLIANIGNFHTLAFRLGAEGIEGVFEHHTGLIDSVKLDALIRALADNSLRHEQVFDDHGHGALIYSEQVFPIGAGECDVVVTGPRRNMMQTSNLKTYYAVPFGDMMIAGCIGLLAAVADLFPEMEDSIRTSLQGLGKGTAPWEIS